ncbi:MAG TPA: CARDB domain-containing protein [Tepidisphaeraceae bacterium]|nr:CARDB domain-containing protein [Tepidisphaeraceae bacterium]
MFSRPNSPKRLGFAVAGLLLAAAGCNTASDGPRVGGTPIDRGGPSPARDSIIGHRDGGTDRTRAARPAAARDPNAPAGSLRHTLAYPTGDRQTSLVMLEVDAPDQVRVGQPYNYQMRITNLTDTPLHDVRVRDLGATGETAATAAADVEGGAGDRGGPGDFQGREPNRDRPARDRRADRTPVWDVGTLQPRQSLTRQIPATADEIGTIGRCLTVQYNPTLCVAVRVVQPELQLVKAGPEYAMICDEITYTYRVTNTGTGVAQGVRIEDALPEGLTAADGGRTLAINVGDLNQGQTREVAARVRPARTGRFASRATATGTGLEAVQSREVATAVRQPVLAVTVDAPESRYTNEPVDYRVTVRNTGDAPAERTVVRLAAPGGTERVVDREVGLIPPGETRAFTVSTRSGRQAGDLRLTATAEARCAKPATEAASVAIRVIPALRLECVDVTDPIRVDGNSAYTIRVTNTGTGPETNVRLFATVPAELTYAGAGADSATRITADGNKLTFAPVATLAPGQAATWTVQVKAVRPGDARFGVEMRSDSLDKPVDETASTRVVDGNAR